MTMVKYDPISEINLQKSFITHGPVLKHGLQLRAILDLCYKTFAEVLDVKANVLVISNRLESDQGDQNDGKNSPIFQKVAKTITKQKNTRAFTSKPNLKVKNIFSDRFLNLEIPAANHAFLLLIQAKMFTI